MPMPMASWDNSDLLEPDNYAASNNVIIKKKLWCFTGMFAEVLDMLAFWLGSAKLIRYMALTKAC